MYMFSSISELEGRNNLSRMLERKRILKYERIRHIEEDKMKISCIRVSLTYFPGKKNE